MIQLYIAIKPEYYYFKRIHADYFFQPKKSRPFHLLHRQLKNTI